MKRIVQIWMSVAFLTSFILLAAQPAQAEISSSSFLDIIKIPAGDENYDLQVFNDQVIVTAYTHTHHLSVKITSYSKTGKQNWVIYDIGKTYMNEHRISVMDFNSGKINYYSTATGELLNSVTTGVTQAPKIQITSDYELSIGSGGYSVSNSHGTRIMSATNKSVLSGLIEGDTLMIQDAKSVQAFNLSTGKTLWTFPLAARYGSQELLRPINGVLYAVGITENTNGRNTLFAIDAQTGAILFKKDLEGNVNSDFYGRELGLHEVNETEDIYKFYAKDGSLKTTFHLESPAIKQLKEKYYISDDYFHYKKDWQFVDDGFYYFKHYAGIDEEYVFSFLKKLDMNGKVQFEKTFDDEYIFDMATNDSGNVFVANGKAFGRYGFRNGTGFKGYNGLNELSVYDSEGALLETIETEYIDKLKFDGSILYGYGDETVYLFKESEPKPSKPVSRIAGTNRFDTAVAISKEGWETSDQVVLATSDDFPDALAGGPLAFKEDAPILLTRTATLPNETKEEIKRLGTKKVIILGSQNAISLGVEAELKKMGMTIERIGGKNRFDTAALIAQRLDSKEAVVAYGFNFPDALSVSAYAAKNGIPILLTRTDKLPAETAAALTTTTKTHVIGSTGAVGENVFTVLPNPTRYGGTTRYDTGLQVNKQLKMGSDKAFIATGMNFPDALAGSVLAAKNDAPILLAQRDVLPPATAKQLGAYNTYTIFGGTGVISNKVREQLNK